MTVDGLCGLRWLVPRRIVHPAHGIHIKGDLVFRLAQFELEAYSAPAVTGCLVAGIYGERVGVGQLIESAHYVIVRIVVIAGVVVVVERSRAGGAGGLGQCGDHGVVGVQHVFDCRFDGRLSAGLYGRGLVRGG